MLTVVELLAKNALCLALNLCTVPFFLSCMWFDSCGSSSSFLIFTLSSQDDFISAILLQTATIFLNSFFSIKS